MPLRSAAWAVEEKLVWGGADAVRGAADSARYPLERLAWSFERRLVWPLQDATAEWSRATRGSAAAGLAAAALAAGVAGAVTASPADPSPSSPAPVAAQVAAPALPSPASAPTPAPAPAAEGPVLQGATPTFEVTEQGGASATASAADAPAAAAPQDPGSGPAAKPVPGQQQAVQTAERFAQAFVLYEIGEETPRVRETFAETASPALVKALRDRPPRQPAGVEVPKARVLNVVPGPSHGDRLTVSAALLRVGSTTELRLDMRRTDEGWRITDVRG